jgi:hypothetical protein
LTANANATGKRSSPIETLEDLKERRLFGYLVEFSLGFDSVLDDTIFIFLPSTRQQRS